MRNVFGRRAFTALGGLTAVAGLALGSGIAEGAPTAPANGPLAQLSALRIRGGRPGGGAAATRTFSFIGRANSRTVTLLNTDTFLINARCDGAGRPVVFGFTSAGAADLFGHRFDSTGRLTLINNSAFTNRGRGIGLSSSRPGDFNSSGILLFENAQGKTVTVNYAFDNSTTLARQRLCTVYGSYTAS